ncbi:PAS domain-containing sensor histidine kinase [Coleofasciculus sp. E2-BRE-01]|uniref:PAS domain-containing sensor histidine kinase n=1 Tax=Coleofasciculus sp. E2-BRE-01 TaxID=3069524 RepID=UPI0032FB96CF
MTNLNQPIHLSQQRLESLMNRINQAADQPEILSTILEEFSITLEKLDQQQQESVTIINASQIELQHYRELFNSTSEAYIVTDITGKIHTANPAASTMLNISPNHLIGKLLPVFVCESHRQAFRTKLEQVNQSCQSTAWEVQLQPRHSEYFPAAIAVSPIRDNQGNLTKLRWLISDIRHRQQAEALRQELAEQQELSELKSRFLGTVSHEFRTPLTTILSSSEMLERYSDRLSPERKTVHFHKISQCVGYMTQLLEDILIYSKADAEKLEFNPTVVNLSEFCQNLVEDLHLEAANQQRIQFKCNDDDICGNFDPKLLRQILSNLLTNALKYSPNGDPVDFELNLEENQAIIIIRDRGIGIPANDQVHLFEPFHRAQNTGTINGTGLGLAIVKKAVDLHQGKISVQSKIDIGTTFTVKLPLLNVKKF